MAHVRSLYLTPMIEKSFKEICVEDAGLIISSEHSYLCALLDCIVQNDRETGGLKESTHILNITLIFLLL